LDMTVLQNRVLIVDDDADFLKALQVWFLKENFEVLVASHGEQASQILRQSPAVDLVLTDFMMPERNGIELVRLLKKDPKLFMIPIAVMSNNTNPEFRVRAHEMGASAYLLKPEGARAVAEKAASLIKPTEAHRPLVPMPTEAIQAMQSSLLALIRLTVKTEGLPAQARSALLSAEKLAESLFSQMPEAG
jgi:CheY-like chemotaxis protein